MFLKVLKYAKYALWSCLFGIAASGGVVATAYYSTLEELPDVEELKHVSFETPMKIFTADGKLIGEFGEHKRIPVSIDQIPLKMQQAFLAIEDSRFYEHSGVDPIGILRAIVVAVTSGGASQGASTITQQVARNFFLTRDRTIERKIKEIFIAWRIEQVLSKDEILELYLNKIALGHRSYGVVAAAQTYYGKTLDQLSLAEIATIAGLPKAPSTLNPITNPKRAKDRRHLVLQRMLTLGYINKEEFDIADSAPSKAEYHSTPLEAYAPYVAEEARQAVLAKFGEGAYTQGFKIYTTVDSNYQQYAHDVLFKNLTDYDVRHGYRGPLYNIYDPARGLRGSERMPVDKTGKNANVNNGLIMNARNALAEQYKENGQKVDFNAIASQVDPQVQLPAHNYTYEDLISLVKAEDKYQSINPALVLAVNHEEKNATLLTLDGEQQLLTWEGMSWARAFKNDRTQGDAPKTPAEFLVPGDVIFTYNKSINLDLKKKADKALAQQIAQEQGLSDLPSSYKQLTLTQLPDVEGALIALDPHNGAVRAMSGGFDFEKSKFNRTTQSLRQTGSNFKPFVYSSAIAYGVALNSVFPDEPIRTWDVGSRTWWKPRNSPNRFEGLMTLREGLAKSKNSISIRTIRHVGVENVVEHLRKFDIYVPQFQQSESMALGSVELTPLQVATAYSAFANGGYRLTPYLIERVEGGDGEVLYQAHPKMADSSLPDNVENAISLQYRRGYQPNARDIAIAKIVNGEIPDQHDPNLVNGIVPGSNNGYEQAMVPTDENNLYSLIPNAAHTAANAISSVEFSLISNAMAQGSGSTHGTAAGGSILSNLDILSQDRGIYNVAPQILSHGHAYLVASLMQSNIYGGRGINGPFWGTGSKAGTITGRKDLHGKTGTTNNVHDAWFSGFNNNIVVTSWVGFDNDRNLGYSRTKGSESGSATALPIFAEFFKKAQEGVPDAQIPRPRGLSGTYNRGINELALPGMVVIDDGSSAASVENTGIDTSSVEEGGDIF